MVVEIELCLIIFFNVSGSTPFFTYNDAQVALNRCGEILLVMPASLTLL
jgi:hypothetical protein